MTRTNQAVAVAVALVAVAGGYYWWSQRTAPPPPPTPEIAVPAPPSAAAAALAAPEIRHPLPASPAAALPDLDRSDKPFLDALAEFLDKRWFALLLSDGLIQRIVATVDALPRRQPPAATMPLKRVPGPFLTTGQGDALAIAPRNHARYQPYVRLVQAADAARLAKVYVAFYPLFQRAYENLGYPGAYFNDRLVVAIDDLLAAPDLAAPIRLVQPDVLYEYAEPALEARSAGQKIMIRMGTANAAIVKDKLRALRREVAGAGEVRTPDPSGSTAGSRR